LFFLEFSGNRALFLSEADAPHSRFEGRQLLAKSATLASVRPSGRAITGQLDRLVSPAETPHDPSKHSRTAAASLPRSGLIAATAFIRVRCLGMRLYALHAHLMLEERNVRLSLDEQGSQSWISTDNLL
jgi:hypothetical protein